MSSYSFITPIFGCSASFREKINNLLIKVSLIETFLKPLVKSKDIFNRFGLKDSHKLRTSFLNLCSTDKLAPESIFWLYFLCAQARTKERIIAGARLLPDSLSKDKFLESAIEFVKKRMVTWTESEDSQKFATVHLPNTNPGLCMFLILLVNPDMDPMDLLISSWAPQINWHESAKAVVVEKSRHFWQNVVTHTTKDKKRVKRNEGDRFSEDIFETQWNDEYPLITISKDGHLIDYSINMKYNMDDFKAWAHQVSVLSKAVSMDEDPIALLFPGAENRVPVVVTDEGVEKKGSELELTEKGVRHAEKELGLVEEGSVEGEEELPEDEDDSEKSEKSEKSEGSAKAFWRAKK